MEGLTVENFIVKIKAMQPRERKHIRADELINIIIQLPDTLVQNSDKISNSISEIMNTLSQVQKVALENSQEIMKLKDDNSKLQKINIDLSKESRTLSENYKIIKNQMDSVETYLRVNNIEITGLPDPELIQETNEYENVEEVVIRCLNGLKPEIPVTSQDIDICHELPKRDGGKTHVVRFISRKCKIMVINAKKDVSNRQYKFRDSTIFINDHLTPANKHLFALAKQKRTPQTINLLKHLWTRNGRIFIRKVITPTS